MARTTPLNMRAEPDQVALLTKAASVLHIDRTAFVLNAACREAENVLLDQRLFQLNETDFAAFEAALDKPLDTPKALKEIMNKPLPWE
jgi:uncharacterized protein (DUF1778 family)